MNSSFIEDKSLLVNEVPFFVCGAELHYFRISANEWEDRLNKAKDCGINTISTYIPWYFHEPQEGVFDFEGTSHPQRNVLRFIDLINEKDFKLIAKPGPFINSELRYGGIPRWLFESFPETLSNRFDGKPCTGRPIPAEGEPVYRDQVYKWYSKIIPILTKYQIDKGGPIILFQPDNELSAAWSYGLGNSLYDPAIFNVYWQQWLKKKYCDIAQLNVCYDSNYTDFQKIQAPRAMPTTRQDRKICLDWMNFKRWFFADWGATLAQWAAEFGIIVPIIFNEPVAGFYEHGDHAGFGTVMKGRGINGTTTCHTYSPKLMDIEGIRDIGIAAELSKSSPWGGPVIAVEVNTDWYMPRMSRSAINWESLLRTGLGHGLKGMSIYSFAAGIVSGDDVIDDSAYFAPSCIDTNGNLTIAFTKVRRFYNFAKAWEKELYEAHASPEVTLAYYPAMRLLDFLGTNDLLPTNVSLVSQAEAFGAEPTLDRGAVSGAEWLDGYEGVSKQTVSAQTGQWRRFKEAALLLTRLNISYDMLDLTNPKREAGHGCLLVTCTGNMEKAAINYLLEHLDKGGGCLFFPTIPIFDEYGRSDNRLKERLGVQVKELVRPAGGEILDYGARFIEFDNGDKASTYNWIYLHDFPQEAKTLGAYAGNPAIVKCNKKNCAAIISGADLAFTSCKSLELWQKVLCDQIGRPIAVRCIEGYCRAMVLKAGKVKFLIATEVLGIAGCVELSVEGRTIEIELEAHESRCMLLNVDLGKQNLAYTTSEIIPLNEKRDKFEIYGRVGTQGRLAFDEPVKLRIDRQELDSVKDGDVYVVKYVHSNARLLCELA